ncbi:NAD(P)/FAD-dependent oxidoreductase [Flavobacteriaceae bacterium]|nr:NAD(P)/FAD-dependent oxidoreductase [Flavobacteriaceae bacterium]
MMDVIIVGGGAAGFFTAINLKEQRPDLKVLILEKSKHVLSKVKISGGGRCNVTHACFIPKDLVKNYPRGRKELLGPFHRFMTGDTMEWFETRGVPLKIEWDGRIFPESNKSESIINCFLELTKKLDIQVELSVNIQEFKQVEDGSWMLYAKDKTYTSKALVLVPGASKPLWEQLASHGHNIVAPIPSLFTFNIKDSRLEGIPGVSVEKGRCKIAGSKGGTKGPILVTHWGLSGPAILKLSAESARELHDKNYQFTLLVNWLNMDLDEVEDLVEDFRENNRKMKLIQRSLDSKIPKRLWERLIEFSQIDSKKRWADLSNKDIKMLIQTLFACEFKVDGKSTFKDEFVTAGGVSLKEINFKTYESKLLPNLFMAGEFIDVDAVTGGFNFQNAWTGGFIIAEALGSRL